MRHLLLDPKRLVFTKPPSDTDKTGWEESVREGTGNAIYVIPHENDQFLAFDGNTRAGVARRLGVHLEALVIEDDDDVAIAQQHGLRQLPRDVPSTYEAARAYLIHQAQETASQQP